MVLTQNEEAICHNTDSSQLNSACCCHSAPGQHLLQVIGDFHAQMVNKGRHQCFGAAHRHLCAQLLQADNIGSDDPAVTDISDNCHLFPFEIRMNLLDGEHIEQSLGGVLMGSIP